MKEFNTAALEIAKRAATPGGQYVLATIGGIRGIRKSEATLEEILAAFKEQAETLLAGALSPWKAPWRCIAYRC